MPKFLDVHPMKGFDEETLRKWTSPAPADEFGVKSENMFYNKEEDRFFVHIIPVKITAEYFGSEQVG